jgi:hypothetical protein
MVCAVVPLNVKDPVAVAGLKSMFVPATLIFPLIETAEVRFMLRIPVVIVRLSIKPLLQ